MTGRRRGRKRRDGRRWDGKRRDGRRRDGKRRKETQLEMHDVVSLKSDITMMPILPGDRCTEGGVRRRC